MLKNPIPVSEFLTSLPLFRGLGRAELKRLAAAIHAVDAPKGTVLSRRGDRCSGFYVVVFGQVKLAVQAQRGNEKIFAELEGYTLLNGTQRVSAYLLDQVDGPDDFAAAEITLPVQKGVIASHLNLTHEHFSRILHDLVETGLIEVKGRAVRILDTARLRSIAA